MRMKTKSIWPRIGIFTSKPLSRKTSKFSRSSLMVPEREYIECERLLLSLANAGYNVDMIPGSLVFELRNY